MTLYISAVVIGGTRLSAGTESLVRVWRCAAGAYLPRESLVVSVAQVTFGGRLHS